MRPAWDDVVARARGLSGHLLDQDEINALARAADLDSLGAMLSQHGIAVAESGQPPRAADLELAIRRWAAAMLTILARWAGPRCAALPWIFADEDRRSIRAMLRGALRRAPAEDRLAGLIPTPELPEKALRELAIAPTCARVAAHLLAWRHPFAAALEPVATPSTPDLLSIEAALATAVARHALAAARRARDPVLQRLVAEAIDFDNAVTAVELARESTDIRPRDLFVPGGTRLDIAAFEQAIATGDLTAAGRRLRLALDGAACAEILPEHAGTLAGFEEARRRCRVRELDRITRIDPLGPATVLRFALQVRDQVDALGRAVWTVVFGAAPEPAGVRG